MQMRTSHRGADGLRLYVSGSGSASLDVESTVRVLWDFQSVAGNFVEIPAAQPPIRCGGAARERMAE